MFGFFKRQIHEPVTQQHADLAKYLDRFADGQTSRMSLLQHLSISGHLGSGKNGCRDFLIRFTVNLF